MTINLQEPLPTKALGPERLEAYAAELAKKHTLLRRRRGGGVLLRRLKDNQQHLRKAYAQITQRVKDGELITPAGEWLIDNAYIIEEQIRDIHTYLPVGYYRKLPKLAGEPMPGTPRVVGLVWHYLEHSEGNFDPESLSRFIRAYQNEKPLSIGELWAIAISLRLVLVENLRRMADWVLAWHQTREAAEHMADRILEGSPANPQRELGQSPLPGTYRLQFIQRLRQHPSQVLETWLNELAEQGLSPEELASLEHQRQAEANALVRNAITSLRSIEVLDWAAFVEGVSLVDGVLRQSESYVRSDFATRDRYRKAIEELSEGSKLDELAVAQLVMERSHSGNGRSSDPGYHLVDKGRANLERSLGYRPALPQRAVRALISAAVPGYLGGVLLLSLLFVALPLMETKLSAGDRLLLGLLALIPASDLAIALLNLFVTSVLPPRLLPKLEFKQGVPEHLRTAVVIPTLITDAEQIKQQIEQLETHYLANPEGAVCFVLLSDWADAPKEAMPGDLALLETARQGIAQLQARHGSLENGSPRFLLLQRRRLWNAGEGRWMGWERKRGKLHEFNRLLLGDRDTTFLKEGLDRLPSDVRYVITLDADTQMPFGTVARLVGTLAHPLNQAQFDPIARRVVEGYGLLQPKVTPALPGPGQDSLYRKAFSGPAGIDPYASAASDVYQDLFGEGNFVGKGIYEVGVFEEALKNRIPENTVLSHDLFEGLFARTALVSDIELIENYPTAYEAHAARQHRWTRGDWQLLPWIFTRRQPIVPVGRWKMLDNLRRSLSAPASLLTLLVAWLIPGALPLVWTGFMVVKVALPLLLPALAAALPPQSGISWRSHLRQVRDELGLAVLNIGLSLSFMAHQAWLMGDAIVRTMGRLFSRKHLLEWQTAAQAASGLDLDLRGIYRRMWPTVGLAWALGILVAWLRPEHMGHALPWLVLWLWSPAIARTVSLPFRPTRPTALMPQQSRLLRSIARRTWHYFERFVDAQNQHLPPDNFQEDPRPKVAHRTSPTNIGLYMLSSLSAHDFGWIGRSETLERLSATLDTLERMEKHRGHLLNWYDTCTLEPLEPRYVSTVDSGNLAGALLACKEACLELAGDLQPQKSLIASAIQKGLLDTFELLEHSVEGLEFGPSSLVGGRQFKQGLQGLRQRLEQTISVDGLTQFLSDITYQTQALLEMLEAFGAEGLLAADAEPLVWGKALLTQAHSHRRDLHTLPGKAWTQLANRLERLFNEMEFGFLYHANQKLFSIGYDVRGNRLDQGSYDLLASEARLASFLAVARGEIPAQHWFRLGRTLTPVERGSALVSWSGSMFEYLMPDLLMQPPPGSLLERTARQVVARQIGYGKERGVPWGVSESAYNARDLEGNYQYSAFGLPGLGLKRGLGEDLVIAPYASALAAMVDPASAAHNLSRLIELGAYSRFGFYDALDYSRERLPQGQDFVLVKNLMAHHQGMSLLALADVLLGHLQRRRFHADPRVRAAELLLQERMPSGTIVMRPRAEEVQASVHVREMAPPALRRFNRVGAWPQTHLLSNGRYTVMLDVAGGGYSRWRDLALTRWRADPSRDRGGTFLFIRDLHSGKLWTATQAPLTSQPETYQVEFSEEQARFFRQEDQVFSTLRVIVAGDDSELRRLSLSNQGNRALELEITTYAEPVLSSPQADSAHPAFAKLFVQTEYVPPFEALLATRRPRSPEEPRLWMGQVLSLEGTGLGVLQYETDRSRFLGRGREPSRALGLSDNRPLSGTTGAVLDPVLVLRRRVRLEPGGLARLCLATVVGSEREEVLGRLDRYRDPSAFEQQYEQTWTRTQVELRHLGLEADEAGHIQELAAYLLYPNPALKARSEIIQRNQLGQAALWKHGISGDLPIVLLQVDQLKERELLRQMMRAYQYLGHKRLAFDLVVLSQQAPSYVQELQANLAHLVRLTQSGPGLEEHPLRSGVFVLRSDLLSPEEQDLLQAVARVVLSTRQGSLAEQLRRVRSTAQPALMAPRPLSTSPGEVLPRQKGLVFDNGLGGFSEGGKEYVIALGEGQWTPAPWSNVIANPDFGFIVTESGSGYTWAKNSREFKLTPWSNDPVSDPPGEVLYIRDELSGELWTPTPLPIRENSPYVIRHAQGYSRFEHKSHGISSELLQFVPLKDSVKISRLSLHNVSTQARRLSVTAYTEWVLGTGRESHAPHVVQELESSTRALLARNPWNPEFSGVAFADMRGQQTGWSGERNGFLGGGDLQAPAALRLGVKLSGKLNPASDSCAVLQCEISLAPGERREVVMLLGYGPSPEQALELIEKYRQADLEQELAQVKHFWDDLLGAVQIQTPDQALDLLVNRWLLYQNLSSRIWARSGFYQAGGAYGFRDQLQDGMALTLTQPALAREHLLRAASRQFPEGDVQHWWHPPSGRGVRTDISDDRLWLPYALTHYLESTADFAVLDEVVPFIEGPAIPDGQEDSYFEPQVSSQSATLFEHAARALERSLNTGPHGLPLIGAGDWNDGMNRVGRLGQGESVWLGWFLHTNLWEWAKLAESRGQPERAKTWRRQVRSLKRAIERSAWDGDWYRRAYFDDGTPLGSVQNQECRIDSIAQSWGIISGAAEPARAERAMAAVDEYLVRRGEGLVLLFTPAFDQTELDPGYVRGYLPGVRENGGQYTHAALWTAMAFAALGQGDKAGELLSMLNPIHQTATRAGVHRYKVEPYVVAADVYSAAGHVGRGGWTWYTGSAGWMYRAVLESLLGFRVRQGRLYLDPCIPRNWPGFSLEFRYHSARYQIRVENPSAFSRGVASLELDGNHMAPTSGIVLQDDGRVHEVRLELGQAKDKEPETA